MEQVKALLINVCIEKCGGPWGSSIVLAAKPYQEHTVCTSRSEERRADSGGHCLH